MIIADRTTHSMFNDFLAELEGIATEKTIIISSPVMIRKGESEIMTDVFPIWLEYYRDKDILNNPFKIIVVGTNDRYGSLPYYVAAFQGQSIWKRLEKILRMHPIDYSTIPGDCSGKRAVSVFFRGHGDGNIRGVLGKITHYINNGILHLQESGDPAETQEIFFKPAAAQLNHLEQRLKNYDDFFRYLPWEEEMSGLKQMTQQVRLFLNAPQQYPDYNGLKDLVSGAYKSISQLMNIHKIDETAGKSGKS